MNFTSLITDISTLISLNSDFPVFTDFPHTAAETGSIYSIVGIHSIQIHKNGSSCVPCDIQVKISMLAPPQTDTHTMCSLLEDNIISIILNSNINVTEVSVSDTELNKKSGLMEIYCIFNITGLFLLSDTGG